jgi:hypothetical protein
MPEGFAYIIIAGLIYFGAVGLGKATWHGVQRVGHGAKVAACKVHLAKCPKPDDTKGTDDGDD